MCCTDRELTRCQQALQHLLSDEHTLKLGDDAGSALAGVDEVDSYQQLCDFVRIVSEGSPVRHFIVHCRKALLNLSTVRNRTVPPLRRGWAFALHRDFPHLQFSINGQACSQAACRYRQHRVAPSINFLS